MAASGRLVVEDGVSGEVGEDPALCLIAIGRLGPPAAAATGCLFVGLYYYSVDENIDERRRGACNFWERRTERMHLHGGLGKSTKCYRVKVPCVQIYSLGGNFFWF